MKQSSESSAHDGIDGAAEGKTITASADIDSNNFATGMTITALVGNGNNDNSNDVISSNVRKLCASDEESVISGSSTNANIGSDQFEQKWNHVRV